MICFPKITNQGAVGEEKEKSKYTGVDETQTYESNGKLRLVIHEYYNDFDDVSLSCGHR